jgi:predicted dehydrogenase
LGSGAIVRDAHVPAYTRLGLPMAGFFDLDPTKAAGLAAKVPGARAYGSLEEALAEPGSVFDMAVPAKAIPALLESLPQGAPVLIQKPMGESLAEARRIVRICGERSLLAAVNFQLRFSPNMLELQKLLKEGSLGAVVDVELRLAINQPWQLWSFLQDAPRVEVLYHSIHYLDLLRRLLGEPRGVKAMAAGHPELPRVKEARGSILLDYGPQLRCSLVMNHTHRQGEKHQASQLMIEGTKGAALAVMGVNLDYPKGRPDRLELNLGQGWKEIPLRGSWFSEAFEGPMGNLQRVLSGEERELVSPVKDALKTMALVEACYQSQAQAGVPIEGEA